MNANELAGMRGGRPPFRIQVISDLHVGAGPNPVRLAPGADILIMAGDMYERIGFSMRALRRAVPRPTPIVMVAGNHEYYGLPLPEQLASVPDLAAKHDVTFLENNVAVIGGVRFLGCTLWTDYALNGEASRRQAMANAQQGMPDHHYILLSRSPRRLFLPSHALARHRESRRWLVEALAQPFDGPTVVVTHHAPTPQSVHPDYAYDPITPAFVSDMTDVVEASDAALWVHGHTHTPFDYRAGRTRVLCNPKGCDDEHSLFQPEMVVEVER